MSTNLLWHDAFYSRFFFSFSFHLGVSIEISILSIVSFLQICAIFALLSEKLQLKKFVMNPWEVECRCTMLHNLYLVVGAYAYEISLCIISRMLQKSEI